MPHFAKPAEGSWTEHYPDLGTALVNYEDSISPEFYELEREAIFRRTWLNVGRVEQIPRVGSYFTKEIDVLRTSIVVVRSSPDQIRAFYNICRHRGNKLVWNDFPREETGGICRQFTCKYHGWRYGLDGALTFVQQESEFFDLDKGDFGLVPVQQKPGVQLTPAQADRWVVLMTQEVKNSRGETYYQALRATIASPQYQRYDDRPVVQAERLRALEGQYKELARRALFREYPLLAKQFRAEQIEERLQSAPADRRDQLRETMRNAAGIGQGAPAF